MKRRPLNLILAAFTAVTATISIHTLTKANPHKSTGEHFNETSGEGAILIIDPETILDSFLVFNSAACASLSGFFMWQACRGKKEDGETTPDHTSTPNNFDPTLN